MEQDLRSVAAWMRRAATEELLDRVTVYRDEIEPAAYDLFRGELDRRDVPDQALVDHERERTMRIVRRPDGSVVRCRKCSRPAVDRVRSWWRIFGILPLVPVPMAVCAIHEVSISG